MGKVDGLEKAALWARVKTDHALGMTQAELIARHGVTHSALNRRIRQEHWPRRNRSKMVDRHGTITQLYRIAERLVYDLAMQVEALAREGKSTDESHALRLGKLAAYYDKVMALERQVGPGLQAPKEAKAMQDVRNRLIERIEQLKRG